MRFRTRPRRLLDPWRLDGHFLRGDGFWATASAADGRGHRTAVETWDVGLSENVGLIFPMIASHLIGIMIINHWVSGCSLFSDTPT